MHRIGEETSDRLDVISAQFRVIVTHRPKFVCCSCEKAVVQAPAPKQLIKGGVPTEAMVAHVLVSKYAWHLPLNRQSMVDILTAVLTDGLPRKGPARQQTGAGAGVMLEADPLSWSRR
jgi:transposase